MKLDNDMRSRNFDLLRWCAFACLASLVGCATTGGASRATEQLVLVVTPCSDLDVSARLMDLEGDLHIHGTVRLRGSRPSVAGHLDAIVRLPDGVIWASVQEQYRSRVRNRLRGGSTQAGFDVVLDGMPPAGSTVTLQHHEGSHVEP